MTGKELWTIFDEECRKNGIEALLFGDGGPGSIWQSSLKRQGPPEDLVLWDTIAKRISKEHA